MDGSGGISEQQRRVAFGIMQYLHQQVSSGALPDESTESLEVALQCIGEVYKLDLGSPEHSAAYGGAKPLEELFSAPSQEPSPSDAEEYKLQGNAHLKKGEVGAALECYSKAIEIDPRNATYFCNRAAALIKQQKLDQALVDCQKATILDPNYARAHGRLGYIYSSLGRYPEAKKSFNEAIRLDPENKNYPENLAAVDLQLAAAEQQQAQQQQAPGGAAAGPGGGRGGFPGLGGMNIGNIMSNPAFMNMASSLMSQPGFQQLASTMMGNVAGGGGGGGAGGGGAGGGGEEGMTPQMMRMAQDMQQNNPELFQSLQEEARRLSERQQNPQNPNPQ